jgi:hypothetical protein
MRNIWSVCKGDELRQGDVLENCAIAIVPNAFSQESNEDEVLIETRRLIVVTQSCDLANGKAPYVALCPIHRLKEMEQADEKFTERGRWEEVRRCRVEGLYMLPSLTPDETNRNELVADFRMIVSLPMGYLKGHAISIGERPRLESPFVEHFSQSFARFFMRVGLPSQIPKFVP